MRLPSIETPEGRRGWAFVALVGGAMTFTVFAGYGVVSLRRYPAFTFWLALAAHAQVALALTAIAALLVRRNIKINRNGFEASDFGDREGNWPAPPPRAPDAPPPSRPTR